MPGPEPGRPTPDPATSPATRLLRAAGEVVLFALVALAPWPFASNEPPFESALAAGVLLLTALWAGHAALTGRFPFRPDVVSVCLAGLALWSAAQLVPLPEPVVGTISPARLGWHRTLLPAEEEVLPGETGPAARPSVLPLTVDPSATRTFLARVIGVLLVYAAARNWLATRAGFRRLAWVLAATGVGLATLALAQSFSSPANVVYWSVPTEGGVFGPFVCRNHYPDYLALCLGLAAGLLLPQGGAGREGPGRGEPGAPALLTPHGVGLAAGVGLMAVSIAFSLSRGGILASVAAAAGTWLLTRAGRAGGPGWAGRAALAAAVAVAVGAAGWFGTERVERRLASVGTADAADGRLAIWRDAARLAPDFWPAGTGNGTFVWAEPTVRGPDRPAADVVENAHNEYLEALVEGGVVRLGLTVGLVVGLLAAVGRGFVARRDRSVGPLLLGAWFGLAAGVFHAAVEFGVHMPAVAAATAAVAGYAVAAARDPEFVPARARGPGGRAARAPGPETPVAPPAPPSPAPGRTAGWGAPCLGLLAAGLALWAALEARGRERAHRLTLAADVAYWDAASPDRLERRAAYLDARAAVRPDDPAALFDAAQGHVDAAVEATTREAGGPGVTPDRFPPQVVDRHLVPALRHLRAARRANPIAPRPHARLALYAEYCTRSEPPAAHFDRAKRLLPTDPDLWFASGKHALRRGDSDAAWADWKRSLTLSPRHLPAVLRAAGGRLSPDEVRARLLPDDPAVLVAAADLLFPDREGQAGGRRPFLEAASAAADHPGRGPDQWAAVAAAADELGRPDEAIQAWRRALELAPDRASVRDGYSRWLEREERYEEAIEQLDWLRQHGGGPAVQDRLDAAAHGLRLQRGLGVK